MLSLPDSNLPLYVRLRDLITERIESGAWKAHQALPSERELIAQLGVSRTTVRQALGDLVAEGVLYRHHGKGTFVAPRKHEPNLTWLAGFAEELRQMGLVPTIEVLSKEMRPAPRNIASALKVQPGETVGFIVRRILTDDEPLLVDRTFLIQPMAEYVLQGDLAVESIYNRIEKLGYNIEQGKQTIGAITLQADDAHLLCVKPNAPALFLQRITYIDHEQPVEYTEAVYRADRFQYQTHLRRRPGISTP